MTNARKTVLVIEDDENLIDLLKIHLGDMDMAVEAATDGEIGVQKSQEMTYDMVILDLMLPKLDGFEVCKQIRDKDKQIPILMLTARSDELDRVLGLELGADDYLVKPFSIRELLARIKAIFRRIDISENSAADSRPASLQIGDLIINLEKRKVQLEGAVIDLTAKEFDLLAEFARNPGRAYTRQDLLDLVWGYQFDGYEHTVNSHINRLRAKIEKDPAHPDYIRTVWGVGYRFAEEEE